MPDSEILRLLAKYRAALARQDEAALRQVIDAYRLIYDRLEGRLDALVQVIQGMDEVSGAKLIRLAQYKKLRAELEDELMRFGVTLDTSVTNAARAALFRGEADAAQLLTMVTGRKMLKVGFQSMNWGAIQSMVGFLQPDSPLYKSIKYLSASRADEVMRGLIKGIGLGDSPRLTARYLAKAFQTEMGKGLTDALRITRTAQLYSYREANRASFAANSDIVTGWVWVADMNGDPPPCLSCVAMNGTEHGLDETLQDHDNGRCAMAPIVMGVNPIEDMQTGEAWFNELPEEKQAEIMGPGKFEAWQEGKFQFGDLSSQQEHSTWGWVWSETPLKKLVGEE